MIALPKPTANTSPICPYFYVCGGCDSQDVSYGAQLAYKEQWLRLLFTEVVEASAWLPIVGNPEEYPTYFRNKIRFAFVHNEDGTVSASRHQKGSGEADIPVDRCYLQSPVADRVMNLTAEIATQHGWSLYDPQRRSGWLKHLLIREGKRTGEMMAALVTDEGKVEGLDAWAEKLRTEIPEVVSIYHSRSWGATNTRFEDTLLWGAAGITERIEGHSFWISPHSFFQTNGSMVEPLYRTIREHAALTGQEHIWDLYAGSATIGIFLANQAQKVTSIESNPANIADAQWNLERNGVANVTMHEGLVEKVVTSAFVREQGPPNVVIIDPPRAGLHERFRQLLPHLSAERIVYVSCNPLTCLRDLKDLTRAGYRVTRAQGIDMFPHSWHCELVLTLEPTTPNKLR